PRPRGRVRVHGSGVLVALHLVAGLEDVLDDPETLGLLHLDHLQAAAVTDVDERQVIGTDVDGTRRFGHGHGAVPQFTRRSEPSQYRARSAFLSGLPSGLSGIESVKSIDLGAWWDPLRSFTSAMSSSASTAAPGRRTTTAFTASP